jgi:hypothetical protein
MAPGARAGIVPSPKITRTPRDPTGEPHRNQPARHDAPLNEDYAIKIARDWNVGYDGAGHVTRFEVESDFLARYPVQQASGRTILELWVPAEELDEFNSHIVGEIEVVHEFH